LCADHTDLLRCFHHIFIMLVCKFENGIVLVIVMLGSLVVASGCVEQHVICVFPAPFVCIGSVVELISQLLRESRQHASQPVDRPYLLS
jgi:hypothetical protein